MSDDEVILIHNDKITEDRVNDLGHEFAYMLGIPHTDDIDSIVRMSMYTMLHDIAYEFEDGAHAGKMLAQFKGDEEES
jgi:hypothetical protein